MMPHADTSCPPKVSKEISQSFDKNTIMAANNCKVLTKQIFVTSYVNSFLLVCQEAGATNKPEYKSYKKTMQ